MMIAKVIGTTRVSRFLARTMYSYWPDHSMEYPGGSLTSLATSRRASWT